MRVLLLSKRQKRELWAIYPFPKGMRAVTGMAPPRRELAWMDARSQLFFLHYDTQRVASTGQVPSVSRTEERQKKLWG